MSNERLRLTIRVKPRSRESSLEPCPDGSWIAHLKAMPVDGQANEELLRLVAKHFRVPVKAVTIRAGANARTKVVDVQRVAEVQKEQVRAAQR